MQTYHYEVTTFAAPFFSDQYSGFTEGNTPMEALKKVVTENTYAAIVETCEVKPKMLARYLSNKAAATQDAEAQGGSILKEGYQIQVSRKVFIEDWRTYAEKWETFP